MPREAQSPAWLTRFAEIAKGQPRRGPPVVKPPAKEQDATLPTEAAVPIYQSIADEFDFWEPFYDTLSWRLAAANRMPRKAAERQALEEVLDDWHQRRVRYPQTHCAGCGEPFGDAKVVGLHDGPQLHPDSPACMAAHEKLWRSAGIKALRGIGVPLPHHLLEDTTGIGQPPDKRP